MTMAAWPECWFCGWRDTGREGDRLLIAVPRCMICEECVGLCAEIVAERRAKAATPPEAPADG